MTNIPPPNSYTQKWGMDMERRMSALEKAVVPLPPVIQPAPSTARIERVGPINHEQAGGVLVVNNTHLTGPRGIIVDNQPHTAWLDRLDVLNSIIEVVDYGIFGRAKLVTIRDSTIKTLGGEDNYCVRGSFDRDVITDSIFDNRGGNNKCAMRLFDGTDGSMAGGKVLGGPIWLGGGAKVSNDLPFLPVRRTFIGVEFVDDNTDFIDFIQVYPGSVVTFKDCLFMIRARLGTFWEGALVNFVGNNRVNGGNTGAVNAKPSLAMIKNNEPDSRNATVNFS